MAFSVNDDVLSRIVKGPHKDKWVRCQVSSINEDGTYKLQVVNPEQYDTYPIADSVEEKLIRAYKNSCTPLCFPIARYTKDVKPHVLLTIKRDRGGSWDKVASYWQKYPDVMRAVRVAAVKKVRDCFKKYEKEISNYKWTLDDMKTEGFDAIYRKTDDKSGRSIYKLLYEMPRRADIPLYPLNRKLNEDNFQRALAPTRYDFELLDSWTVEEKGMPNLELQIRSEKSRIPYITDRYSTYIHGVRDDNSVYLAVDVSIKHPLKKEIKGLTRCKFENYAEHRLQKDGSLQSTIVVNMDLGGMVPIKVVNMCMPRIVDDFSKFLVQIREYDFSNDSDWNPYYAAIGSIDKM